MLSLEPQFSNWGPLVTLGTAVSGGREAESTGPSPQSPPCHFFSHPVLPVSLGEERPRTPRNSSLCLAGGPFLTLSFICFVPGLPFRGVTEETCLGEVAAGSGHTAGLEGLIKGSELPGLGRGGLRRGLLLRGLAQEGVDVLNIK